MVDNLHLNIDKTNLLYISQFGSYGTSEWIENISDIDIGVLVSSLDKLDYSLEYVLQDYFKELYNYDNVNITIIELDINNQLARNIICGKTFYSILEEKELKYKSLYLTKSTLLQREYYHDICLEKAKEDLFNLW